MQNFYKSFSALNDFDNSDRSLIVVELRVNFNSNNFGWSLIEENISLYNLTSFR